MDWGVAVAALAGLGMLSVESAAGEPRLHQAVYPGYQWHLENPGGVSGTAGADARIRAAWKRSQGKPSVVVAVIEAGFDVSHISLRGQFVSNADEANGIDGVDDDWNGCIDDVIGCNFLDMTGDLRGLWMMHGTQVAGLVGANDSVRNLFGACPRCRLLPIVFPGPRDTARSIAAFRYAAARGARIIVGSFGTNSGSYHFLEPVIKELYDQGVILVFSAGNGSRSTLSYPASDPHTIAVGGSDCLDKRYAAGNYGSALDILAPTRQTYGHKPLCTLWTTRWPDNIGPFGGTSGAAPITAGIIGLMLAVDPLLTPSRIRAILRSTADKIDGQAAAYDRTGFSRTHGYGRINAQSALAALP